MAKTVLEPIMGYTSKERKDRLNRIVEATSRRMTVSKLIDEAVEMVLPQLEAKYGTLEEPTHEAPKSKRRRLRHASAA